MKLMELFSPSGFSAFAVPLLAAAGVPERLGREKNNRKGSGARGPCGLVTCLSRDSGTSPSLSLA